MTGSSAVSSADTVQLDHDGVPPAREDEHPSIIDVRTLDVELVNLDRDLDSDAHDDQTTLIRAVRLQDDLSAVNLLLASGAEVDARNERGEAALHFASSVEVVRLLLDHGASVHALDAFNRTPLFRAVRCGRAGVAEELIRHGADVHAVDAFGQTAMFQVDAFGDSVSALEVLVDHGASVKVSSYHMDTPLHRAAMFGKLSTVRFLMNHGAPMEASTNSQTPLYEATANGHCDVLVFLLNRGADVHGDPAAPSYPLLTAAIYGDLRIVAELLARGASFEISETMPTAVPAPGAVPSDIQVIEAMVENIEMVVPNGREAAAVAFNSWFAIIMDDLYKVTLELGSLWYSAAHVLEELLNYIKSDESASTHATWVEYAALFLRLWKWRLEYADREAAGEEQQPGAVSRQDSETLTRLHIEVDTFHTTLRTQNAVNSDCSDDERAQETSRFYAMSESEQNAEIRAFATNNLPRTSDGQRSEGSQPGRDVWVMLLRVALSLEALHAKQVVHGELAPKQARAPADAGEDEAVRWKAPETVHGASEILASDVYSFGMCVIEVASGQVPWANVSTGAVSVLVGLHRLPRRPEVMSDEQWQLVEFLCAREPAQRPAMPVVVKILQDLVEQEKQQRVDELIRRVLSRE